MKQQGDATLKTTMVVSYIGWLVVLFFSGNAIAESTTDQQYQAAMSPPGTVGWGPRYATPGVVLTLREIFNSRGSRVAGYKLEASGFPIDKIYNLWMHSLGKVMDGDDASLYRIEDAPAPPYEYHINAWGKLIPANEFTILLDVYKFAKFTDGEWFGIALISTDRSVKGYAEVIPRPIEATKGTCRIWLKRVTLHSYLVSGEGFEPGEEVTAISRFRPSLLSRSKTIESKHTVLSDGHHRRSSSASLRKARGMVKPATQSLESPVISQCVIGKNQPARERLPLTIQETQKGSLRHQSSPRETGAKSTT